MSDYRSIAVITAALHDIVQWAVQDIVPGVTVRIGPPRAVKAGDSEANIYLYRLSPNAQLRNVDLPRMGHDGEPWRQPLTAVDLHYLISFSGEEQLATELMLGRVASVLHAAPGIGRQRIERMLRPGGAYPALAGSDLSHQHDLVVFTPEFLTLDEMSKLWTVFFQLAHRPSLQYIASPVLLGAGRKLPAPKLVERIAFSGLEGPEPA